MSTNARLINDPKLREMVAIVDSLSDDCVIVGDRMCDYERALAEDDAEATVEALEGVLAAMGDLIASAKQVETDRAELEGRL